MFQGLSDRLNGIFKRLRGYGRLTEENIGEALSRGAKSIVDTVTLAAIATPLAGILSMVAALVGVALFAVVLANIAAVFLIRMIGKNLD